MRRPKIKAVVLAENPMFTVLPLRVEAAGNMDANGGHMASHGRRMANPVLVGKEKSCRCEPPLPVLLRSLMWKYAEFLSSKTAQMMPLMLTPQKIQKGEWVWYRLIFLMHLMLTPHKIQKGEWVWYGLIFLNPHA